jgi:SAM-dependent methyltransferase
MDRRTWDERYRDRDFVWSAEPNRFLVEVAADLPPGRALDLAAGEGRNAVWLAGRGWAVTAVDWSEVGLDKGRRLAEHHGVQVSWVAADLTAWRPDPQTFDLVVILYLQVPRPVRAPIWVQASAAVAPGGRLVIVGHDLHNLSDGYGGPSSPEVLYTADEVRGVVEPLLPIERADTVLRPVETEAGVRYAIDNLTVARRPE